MNPAGADGLAGDSMTSSTSWRNSMASVMRSRWSPTSPSSSESTIWLMVSVSVTPVMTAATSDWNSVSTGSVLVIVARSGDGSTVPSATIKTKNPPVRMAVTTHRSASSSTHSHSRRADPLSSSGLSPWSGGS